MAKKLFILHGSLQEVKSEGYFETRARIEALERERELLRASVREMVGRMADKGIVERAYEALGEDPPPRRKLKGPLPRYQQELVESGDLKV